MKQNFIFEIESEDMTDKIQPIELNSDTNDELDKRTLKVRLDKWLWAARFFKTIALARSAIEDGRVYYEGKITAPSKEITIGTQITINHGKAKTVVVLQLCTRRRNTDDANALFKYLTEEYPLQTYITPDMSSPNPDKRQRKVARFLRRTLVADEANKNKVI